MNRPTSRPSFHSSLDAYGPDQIAQRVEDLGVKKARYPLLTTLLLAGLAGAFISLGAIFYTVVIVDSNLGFGITRLVGGLAFCLGLVLVIVAGAELFTGNNLVAMAWASRRIRFAELTRNWALVYIGNVIGCLGTVALVYFAGIDQLGSGNVGEKAIAIAVAKSELSWSAAFARGVLCNALVCLAVWLAMAGRTVTDKILAVLFPISAFVAAGFEHSIANWFFLPYGIVLDGPSITLGGVALNLTVVTLGNVFGGSLLVAGVYWVVYLRDESRG